MKKIIIKYLILFSIGFIAFTLIEQFYRQYTFFWSGVLGGLSIIVLDKFNNEISWELDLFWQALMGGAVITTMELITGLIAKYTNILPVMWDYSRVPFNFKGIICLRFSIYWILLGSMAIFIADTFNYYLLDDKVVPHYTLFGKFKFSFKRKENE